MTERERQLMTRCVNAHDRCYLGGPCPYCEPVNPLRWDDGTFAALTAEQKEPTE